MDVSGFHKAEHWSGRDISVLHSGGDNGRENNRYMIKSPAVCVFVHSSSHKERPHFKITHLGDRLQMDYKKILIINGWYSYIWLPFNFKGLLYMLHSRYLNVTTSELAGFSDWRYMNKRFFYNYFSRFTYCTWQGFWKCRGLSMGFS